nr:VanW family protein [Motilibacter aurantiacus]
MQDRVSAPIRVTVGDGKFTVDPKDAGLSLDAAATVRAAGAARSWNPADIVRRFTGGDEVDPVVRTDAAKLASAVAGLAAKADKAPQDGAVTFDGKEPVTTEARPGVTLDQDAAPAALQEAYLRPGDHPLPAAVTEPAVDADEVQRALAEFVEPAVASPVTIVAAGERVRVPPGAVTQALSLTGGADGRLVPELDTDELAESLRPRLTGAEVPARNATFEIEGDRPRVVPARPGRQVDMTALAADLLDVLPEAASADRVVNASLEEAEPDLTTAEARKLGVKELVSEFTTYYPYAAYRVTNIGRAAELIDGTLLEPGEEFSLNGIVGERTLENGFAVGTIIRGGRFAEELGGGVSQVATTTFNAMFFAGLKDVQHKPHSFYISRYPEGREATVAWPTLDLKFLNDTSYGVFIQTVHDPGDSLTVRMFSTKHREVTASKSARYNYRGFSTVYDTSAGCVPQGGVSGFDVDVTRTITEKGKKTRKETFHTRYNPANQIYCRAEPAPPRASTTPAPSTSASPDAG